MPSSFSLSWQSRQTENPRGYRTASSSGTPQYAHSGVYRIPTSDLLGRPMSRATLPISPVVCMQHLLVALPSARHPGRRTCSMAGWLTGRLRPGMDASGSGDGALVCPASHAVERGAAVARTRGSAVASLGERASRAHGEASLRPLPKTDSCADRSGRRVRSDLAMMRRCARCAGLLRFKLRAKDCSLAPLQQLPRGRTVRPTRADRDHAPSVISGWETLTKPNNGFSIARALSAR